MIKITQKGDYSKISSNLEKMKELFKIGILDKYGRKGVELLSEATPRDTGLTANSWYYRIRRDASSFSLIFYNSNVVDGVPIAIILQYGHATRNGGYVEGRDYINPALKPVFDELANDLWREVDSV